MNKSQTATQRAETSLCGSSYPLAFFWRCCSWAGARMRPFAALSPVSFANFGGRAGGRGGWGGHRWSGGGRVTGGWRVRRPTVWRRRRGWFLLLLDGRRGVVSEKRLEGHGGSLKVFLLLLFFGWRALHYPLSPWKNRGRWEKMRILWLYTSFHHLRQQSPERW